MRQVIVIGAGASGLAAAIASAREGAQVTLLDGMKKPGRKLLLTGNGRCNLTNLDPELPGRYHSEDPEGLRQLTESVFRTFSVQDTLRFFEDLGISLTDREGWVYPRSAQAAAVLSALLRELKRLKVKQRYDAKVMGLRFDKEKQKWMAAVGDWEYSCDSVVLCCGSKAAPATGSDGSGYELAEMTGHEIITPVPSLTAVHCTDRDISLCAGARTRASLAVCPEGFPDDGPEKGAAEEILTFRETGEIQWTETGISGIAVFQLSRLVSKAAEAGRTVPLRIDLLPGLGREEAEEELRRLFLRYQGMEKTEALLTGYVPERIAAFLVRKSGRTEQELAEESPEHKARLFAGLLKGLPLTAKGTRGFEQAQAAAGGVRLSQVTPETLESRMAPGLYFAGELLDVDGRCGGYNLQWAWSSGCTAGKAAAGRLP